VNPEIFLATLEQRLRSPVRLALAAAFVAFAAAPYLLMLAMRELPRTIAPSTHGGMLALVFAAGVLGQEFSSGAPQITFTRPLARWSWVLSRALAVALMASICAILPYLVGFFAGMPAADLGLAMLEQVAQAIGTTAVVLGLSALVPGLTDLALLAGANIGFSILGFVAAFVQKEPLRTLAQRAKDYIEPWFSPKLDLVGLAHGATFSPHAFFMIASTVVFWLVVAIVLVNRKELSYATD
jgi:ABC-type transport system involved in multi-copper enzyme maturation permease subunit